MQLMLSSEEAAALHELLGRELSDLRVEIRRTDAHDVREQLRARERVFGRLMTAVGGPQPAEA